MEEKDIFLKDNVINKIFGDEDFRDFLIPIINNVTDFDTKTLDKNLKIVSLKVNGSTQLKDTVVDNLYEVLDNYINIEVNFSQYNALGIKNLGYICRLFIRDHKAGKKYLKKKVWQINIDNFDVLKKGDLIYKGGVRDEVYNLPLDDSIAKIHINMEFIRKLDYNKVKEMPDDSLEKMLYIFVCNNKKLLDRLYKGNDIMEKVKRKLEELTESFDAGFYYDPKELEDACAFEAGEAKGRAEGIAIGKAEGRAEGKDEGRKEEKLKVAKKLLAENVEISLIIKATGLTEEEIEKLK